MTLGFLIVLNRIKLKISLQHMDVLNPGEWVGALEPWMDKVSIAGNRSEMSAVAKDWQRPFCGVKCRMHQAPTQLPTFYLHAYSAIGRRA